MSTRRIEKAFAALTVDERVTLQFRAFSRDEEADRLIFHGLPPGKYNCQITILNPTGQKAAFWQAPVVLVP